MGKIIFHIDGGMGKCVAATAVCKAIRAQYPDKKKNPIIVVSAYPEVFMGNNAINETLHHKDLCYFYERNIMDKKSLVLMHDPYHDTNYINCNGHLIRVWCEMFGIKYNGELPEIFLTDREKKFYANLFRSDKPIFLIQTNGGAAGQPVKYSWARDMPITVAQQVVNEHAKDYKVYHIRREDQFPLENATPVHGDFRMLAALIVMSEKRLFIDSFAQHTAAALSKPSVVFFIANTPEQLGYDMHTNVLANPFTREPEMRYSIYSPFSIAGEPIQFPYNDENEIVYAKTLMAALHPGITIVEGTNGQTPKDETKQNANGTKVPDAAKNGKSKKLVAQ